MSPSSQLDRRAAGDGKIDPVSIEDNEARANLVGTLIAAIATGAGLDASAATTAGLIETRNNAQGGVRFGDCIPGQSTTCGPPYASYKDFDPNDPQNGAYRRQYDLAVAALSSVGGIAPSEADIALILEASIGGRVDDDIEGFVTAFGGLESLRNLVAGGQSATALGERFRAYESAKFRAFLDVSRAFSLSEINRFANDPRALATLSINDQQLVRLAYSYAQDNPLTTVFAPNASFGSGVSFLNDQYQLGTRGLGAVQGVAGTFGGFVSGTGAVASGAACPVTFGAGCAGAVGLGVLTVIEFDQAQAGFRTAFSGRQVNSFGAQALSSTGLVSVNTADLGLGLTSFGTSVIGGGRAIITSADNAIAETLSVPTAFGEAARISDEALAASRIPQVTINQIAGSQFERQVLDALGFVGATKNVTLSAPRLLPTGETIRTIVDSLGRNVGGFLEIKDVQRLTQTRQLRSIIDDAIDARAPLNIVVSPSTRSVSGPLRRAVRATGGNIFVFNPATGTFTPF